MKHSEAVRLLQQLDLGSSIAELDNRLEGSRVETSAFTDLMADRVDLIPGTKGSGKSALFRIIVDFLPTHLLQHRKVVVAHGVQHHGDSVFHAFKEEFETLSEGDFVGFWGIYLISLAHEHFIKGEPYQAILSGATAEVERFRRACQTARIPDIKARKSLREILAWALTALKGWIPKLTYKLPNETGEIELDFFGTQLKAEKPAATEDTIPKYLADVKDSLESVLLKTDLSIWLMIDRLDEVFPRRSGLERRALRGLLRAMRLFTSNKIRVKVFLRDDMLEQVLSANEGFTALTHLTARQADTLRWSQEQILTMVVKRLFAAKELVDHFKIDPTRLDASDEYRTACFYRVFPDKVYPGPKQSDTLRWIYNHTRDGRGVVTPRDILDLVTRAKQKQQDSFNATPEAESSYLIGPQALQYGLEELSKRKRETYLQAEFPHLWPAIEKFQGGKSDYSVDSIKKLLGGKHEQIVKDLVAVGLLAVRGSSSKSQVVYSIPFLYRKGLEITQGQA